MDQTDQTDLHLKPFPERTPPQKKNKKNPTYYATTTRGTTALKYIDPT